MLETTVRPEDIDTEALLKIPEVQKAWDDYQKIKTNYRWELVSAIRRSKDGRVPDVHEIADKYDPMLEEQEELLVQLAFKHSS